MANRIEKYISVPQVEGIRFDVSEDTLSQQIERFAWESICETVSSLQDRVRKLEEQQKEIERRAMKFASVLNGATLYVAKFAKEHKDKLKDVHLGVCDGQFRFVLITSSTGYDWDFSESIADLQSVLLEDYADIPLCCRSIPASAAADVDALMATKLMHLTLRGKENAGS